MLTVAPAKAFPTDPAAIAEICTRDSGPQVCITTAHARGLPSLVGPARQALRLLAKLPNPPTSVHEVTPDHGYPQPVDQAWLDSDSFQQSHNPRELTVRILAGAGTRRCDTADNRTYLDTMRARAITAAWLYGHHPAPGQTVGGPSELALREHAWKTFNALPADEQKRRVSALRTAGLTCGDQAAALGLGAGE
jgi:hypothetical protein